MINKNIRDELRERSYSENEIAKIINKQVLIVPQLIISEEDTNDRSQLIRGEVSDIRKLLTQAGFETEVILDQALGRKALIRRDADIVFPLILFAANIPLNIITSYIANWLFTRFQDKKINIRYEHARFGSDGKIIDYIKLEGKADEVAKILRSRKLEVTNDSKKIK